MKVGFEWPGMVEEEIMRALKGCTEVRSGLGAEVQLAGAGGREGGQDLSVGGSEPALGRPTWL